MPAETAPKTRAKKQTQEDSGCVFGDGTERHTNSHFVLSYSVKFKLIISNLILEGVRSIFLNPKKHYKYDTFANSI